MKTRVASARATGRPVRSAGSELAPTRPELFPVADPGTMIGRQAELELLLAAWKGVTANSPRFVLVAGEPGVGKTRLVAELALRLECSGVRVLAGRCRRDPPLPYEPFVEALGPVPDELPDGWYRVLAEPVGPALARLLPAVAHRMPGPALDRGTGSRSRLAAALAAAVTSSGRRPVLLVLEDLHWATPSTVLVLEHLARQPCSSPLLVVGTCRSSTIAPNHPLRRLLQDPALRPAHVFLDNLSQPSVAALLVDRAAVAGAEAAGLAGILWRATEGHPLLVTELIRDLDDAGALSGGTVEWRTIDEVGVARTVEELVERRLRIAGSRVRAVLELASVIGTSFPTDLLVQVCGYRGHAVQAALRRSASLGLTAAAPGSPDHRFVHDAVRDAVRNRIGVDRRLGLQIDLAGVLRRRWRSEAPHPAVVAHHATAASPIGRSPEAAEQARAAGRAAMEVLAFEEAAAWFGEALARLGWAGDPMSAGLRCDSLMLLGGAHHGAGEAARARQSYLQAAAVARGLQDGPRLGRAVLGLGESLDVWGADALLIGLLEVAVGATTDPAMRARLVARLTQAQAALDVAKASSRKQRGRP